MGNDDGVELQFVNIEEFKKKVFEVVSEKQRQLVTDSLQCTLGDTSLDDTHSVRMVESEFAVSNFDGVAGALCAGAPYNMARKRGEKRLVPCSPDALVISEKEWHLIEFKNGRVDETQVIRKMYDSILLAVDLNIVANRSYFNKFVSFILVYNPDRLDESQKRRRDKARNRQVGQGSKENTALIRTQAYLKERAEQDFDPFGITKLERYLFHRVIVQTQRRFVKTYAADWGTRMPKRQEPETKA